MANEGEGSNKTTLFQRFMQAFDSSKIDDKDKSDAHKADDSRMKFFQNFPFAETFSKDLSGKAGGRGLIGEAGNFVLFTVDVTKKLLYQSVKQPAMMAYQAVMGAGSFLRLGFNLSQYPAKACANLGITLYNKFLSKKLTPYKLSDGLPESKEFLRNFTYRASEFLKATVCTAALAAVAASIPATFGSSVPVLTAAVAAVPGFGAALGFSKAGGAVISSAAQSSFSAATPIVQSGIAATNSAVSAVTSGLSSVSASTTAHGLPAASSNSAANGAVYAAGALVASGVTAYAANLAAKKIRAKEPAKEEEVKKKEGGLKQFVDGLNSYMDTKDLNALKEPSKLEEEKGKDDLFGDPLPEDVFSKGLQTPSHFSPGKDPLLSDYLQESEQKNNTMQKEPKTKSWTSSSFFPFFSKKTKKENVRGTTRESL